MNTSNHNGHQKSYSITIMRLLMLFQMLHIVECLSTIRFRTNEVTTTMSIMRSQMNVQITTPVEYPGNYVHFTIPYLLQPVTGHRYE